MTIEELRARLRQVNADAKAIIDAASKDNRDLTDDEQAKFDALDAEFNRLKADLDRRERVDRQTADLGTSNGRRTEAAPAQPRSNEPDPATTFGFHDMAEFGRAVQAACRQGGVVDPRLTGGMGIEGAPTNFHRETGGTDGYMVPPAMRDTIWELVFEGQNLLNLVDGEPTARNAVEMLADETTPWGATGVQANWRSEGQQMSASRLATEGRSVKLHELYAFVLATDELLEDAPRLNNRLTRQAARAINWKASDAIVYGNGVGQPLGYFNSTALVSVAKESGQGADTILAKNVAKMYSRLLPEGLSRSLWLANSDILPEIMTLTIGDKPIWTPPNAGFQDAPGGFLLGRPIMFTEHAKTLGDKGDLQLIDPMGYYAPRKQSGIKFDSSIHLYFDYGIQAFRWTFRFGGQPYLSAPVSPKHGTNTKSHFVVLDDRA